MASAGVGQWAARGAVLRPSAGSSSGSAAWRGFQTGVGWIVGTWWLLGCAGHVVADGMYGEDVRCQSHTIAVNRSLDEEVRDLSSTEEDSQGSTCSEKGVMCVKSSGTWWWLTEWVGHHTATPVR